MSKVRDERARGAREPVPGVYCSITIQSPSRVAASLDRGDDLLLDLATGTLWRLSSASLCVYVVPHGIEPTICDVSQPGARNARKREHKPVRTFTPICLHSPGQHLPAQCNPF